MIPALRGERYLPGREAWLRQAVREVLPALDFAGTRAWYAAHARGLSGPARAFLCCNDLFFCSPGRLPGTT